jgi:hypothetical protein
MLRKLIALSALCFTLVICATSTAQAGILQLRHKPFSHMTNSEKVHYLKRQIRHDRSILRFAQNHIVLEAPELRQAVHWAKGSIRIASKNLKQYTYHAPVVSASNGVIAGLMCIHSYEGSWSDPDAPYWGGLQMDYNFQDAYGHEFLRRWGTADHWPVWAQLQAGTRAYNSRGWGPWPNTARYCGLM